jgi:phosphate transport system permease protein
MSVSIDALSAPELVRGHDFTDRGFRWLTAAVAIGIVLLIAAIAVNLYASSAAIWAAGPLTFITGDSWDPGAEIFGALPFIAGTLITSGLALLLAVPVGLLTAIFLAEFAPRWLARPLTFVVELTAAVPSVVVGLWGLLVITPLLRDTVETWTTDGLGASVPFLSGTPTGSDVFAASLILSIMIVPTVVAISREVIVAVPGSVREAYLGLGATRLETVLAVVLPAARSGLIGAVFLALGRAIGETMAVAMMIGNADRVPTSLFDQAQTISSKIATTFAEAGGGELQGLLGLGLVLLLVTLLIGTLARLLIGGVPQMRLS